MNEILNIHSTWITVIIALIGLKISKDLFGKEKKYIRYLFLVIGMSHLVIFGLGFFAYLSPLRIAQAKRVIVLSYKLIFVFINILLWIYMYGIYAKKKEGANV